MSPPAYLDAAGFLAAPPLAAAHRYAVVGLPWDGATTNRPGARFGPAAIRRASRMLCDGIHPHFDVSPLAALGDGGDLPLPNTSIERMRAVLEPAAGELLKRHHICWLGGDHSVTLSLLRAHRARLGRPLAVVHFDAHCDTWEDHFGEPSGHGTWVFEAVREGLVVESCFTQIGIRSAGHRAARDFVADRGGRIHSARALRGVESPGALREIVDDLRQRLRAAGDPPLYLSLDIDCLDPAFAPGTGTPEPAGLTTTQLSTLLEELAALDFVGMDCVEVAPPYDHAELAAQAAAHAVWTYLCGQVARQTVAGAGTG